MTANAPDTAIPYPAQPSLTPKPAAIGVSRLTGMNSEAMSANTHKDMANTPPQFAAGAGISFEPDSVGSVMARLMDAGPTSLPGSG